MKDLAIQRSIKAAPQQVQNRSREPAIPLNRERLPNAQTRSTNLSGLAAAPPLVQRTCACGGSCPRCQAEPVIYRQRADEDGADLEHEALQPSETVGSTEQGQPLGGETSGAPSDAGTPTQATPPCPTSVTIGQVSQFNHSNLSAADQLAFRTYLGAVSRMDVGPGPDHSGHCMKEQLTTVSNNCPAAVYSRGGTTSSPCTGNRCLDINRWGSAGDARTHTTLSDGPTSFIDLHRTLNSASLLEGTGVSTCSVVCEQIYKCDRTGATTGRFQITRNYQAGTVATGDGGTLHITTGTVTKT